MRQLCALAIAASIASPTLAAPSTGQADVTLAAGATAPVKPAKVRCRNDYEIGSLVKRIRRCGDAATWRKSDDAVRDQTTRMQQDLTGRYELPR